MLRFVPIPTGIARHYQAGGVDSYGLLPERKVSDGGGNPCRHCLRMIPEGKGMLVLAHRPFGAVQPYAETGPIFLCAEACEAGGGADVPEILARPINRRGYGRMSDVYGTAGWFRRADLRAGGGVWRCGGEIVHVDRAEQLFFQLRVERAG